jgi:hypothetical protein
LIILLPVFDYQFSDREAKLRQTVTGLIHPVEEDDGGCHEPQSNGELSSDSKANDKQHNKGKKCENSSSGKLKSKHRPAWALAGNKSEVKYFALRLRKPSEHQNILGSSQE